VEFRKEEKRNAYRMLMEKPLESTARKTETNMRRSHFEIYLREPKYEKGNGTEYCSIGGFVTMGFEIQASEAVFLPALMSIGKSS
jgi:hypothetical protein